MIRTYRFGARPPVENSALAMEQVWRAHRYRNQLVEIERKRRDEIAKIDRTTDIGKKQVERTNEDAKESARQARAKCGVYWGSYLLVEAAMGASRRAKDMPRFLRWDGTGRIGVELQKGLAVDRALSGADTRLKISCAPDPSGMTLGSRRSGKRFLVSLRIGSDGNRNPIWASWPVTIHRLLPTEGIIKWAVAQRYRIGPDYRWALQFSIEENAIQRTDATANRDRVVAIDLGWRMRPLGCRVGYWLDSTGRNDEVLMPESISEDLEYIRSIGAIRRRLFNDFLPQIAEWCQHTESSEWFAAETETIAQWKSPNRLAELIWRWGKNRFDGDAEMFDRADAWRRQDRHLHKWWAHGTAKVLGHRNEIYKKLTATFAREYKTIVIEHFNLSQVAGRAGLDDNATDGEKIIADNASSRRHAAAPGVFRQALLNACSTRGTQVVSVPAEYTTQVCWRCQCGKQWDAAPMIDHSCEDCNEMWDQDWNACRNMLNRYASSDGAQDVLGALAERNSAKQERFRTGKEKNRREKERSTMRCSQAMTDTYDIIDDARGAVETPAQWNEN